MITSENHSLLTLKEYKTILSDITKAPFVDKKGACYMFEIPSEARMFCENNPHTYESESKHMQGLAFWVSNLYLSGVKSVNIKTRENNHFVNVVFGPEDIKSNLYDNHNTNFHLLQLKQYSLKRNLRGLREGLFITPIMLPPRSEGEYPKINYCYVTKNSRRFYVLFSNLKEFQTWNEKQNNAFSPLITDFLKAKRIRKKDGVLINPLSDKMMLTNEHLNMVEQE